MLKMRFDARGIATRSKGVVLNSNKKVFLLLSCFLFLTVAMTAHLNPDIRVESILVYYSCTQFLLRFNIQRDVQGSHRVRQSATRNKFNTCFRNFLNSIKGNIA
jgi:hypothetical protein